MRLFTLFIALGLCLNLSAQKEGMIEYEEVMQININLEEIPEEFRKFAENMPKERKSNMVLLFNTEKSMYKESSIPVEMENNPFGEGRGHGGRMRMMGGNGELYKDIKADKGIRFIDMMGAKFLIQLPAEKTKWKLSNTQKEIAGYVCIKATAIVDSSEVIAWFTPQVPVAVGPQGFGDLPGAILMLETKVDRGLLIVRAKEVKLEALKKEIEEPKKGDKVTEEEFETMMRERMEQMREQFNNQRENGGDGDRIIIHGGGR
ncbi:MAG: GLPGLI family protein [Limisphaerales bacterium]|jgi:GLPGLI family protein